MRSPKKLLLCLAVGLVLTVLAARVPGSQLLSNVAPITVPQHASSATEENSQTPCLSITMSATTYGSPLRMYEHFEQGDGCGGVYDSPAHLFPVSIIINILFWTAVAFGGTVLVARWQKRSTKTSATAALSRVRTSISTQSKPHNLTLAYIFFGGLLGLGFCLSFALFAADLVMYRTDSFIMPVGVGEMLSRAAQSQGAWIMLACGSLLAILVAFRKRFQASVSANWSILLPLAASVLVQLLVLISGLSRTQRAAGPYDTTSITSWLIGWSWTFLVYFLWLVVMVVLAIKRFTNKH